MFHWAISPGRVHALPSLVTLILTPTTLPWRSSEDVDESKTLDVAKKTEINLDGKKATLAALKKDQYIEVTMGEGRKQDRFTLAQWLCRFM
jgi:hypothetical protein